MFENPLNSFIENKPTHVSFILTIKKEKVKLSLFFSLCTHIPVSLLLYLYLHLSGHVCLNLFTTDGNGSDQFVRQPFSFSMITGSTKLCLFILYCITPVIR